jgi:hemolysin activation/secretion protein
MEWSDRTALPAVTPPRHTARPPALRATALASLTALTMLTGLSSVHAQSAPEQAAEEGLRRLEERQREQQRALQPQADVLRPAPAAAATASIPDETPCFVIDEIALAGPDRMRFAWLTDSAQPFVNRCLGVQGLRQVVATLDAKLIELGYVTTRVSLPAQNLSSGKLQLQLHVGRVGEVRMVGAGSPSTQDTAWGTWRNAFLLRQGHVLNARDLEQGVEQMKRLPSQRVTITL